VTLIFVFFCIDRGHDLLVEIHRDVTTAGGQFHSGNEFLFEIVCEYNI